MTKIKEIISILESFAPKNYQESYDNSGLLCGNPSWDTTGILTTLDVTESVIDEAIERKCNLIVAHHPIIFKGLKKITGSNYVERTLIKAIKNDICIYAIHTNLDNVSGGVNYKIAEKLGLQNVQILAPKANFLRKLTVFVPKEQTESLAKSLHEAGAGNIGNYQYCSFRIEGTGTFMPNERANPHIGEKNKLEYVNENRIELIYSLANEGEVLNAMRKNHPYEEVAHYISNLENVHQEIGSGTIGTLSPSTDCKTFLEQIKHIFGVPTIKCGGYVENRILAKVAICGGSGVFLLNEARKQKADIFITSDVKYHEFFDTENEIVLADIGHYESEQFTKELLYEIISKNIPNIAVLLSKTNTNPVQYI